MILIKTQYRTDYLCEMYTISLFIMGYNQEIATIRYFRTENYTMKTDNKKKWKVFKLAFPFGKIKNNQFLT